MLKAAEGWGGRCGLMVWGFEFGVWSLEFGVVKAAGGYRLGFRVYGLRW